MNRTTVDPRPTGSRRAPLPLLVLALASCTPFEGSSSGQQFAQTFVEEAFPGARITGHGEAELDLDEGQSLLVPYVVQEGMAVSGGDMILGPVEDFTERSAALRNTAQRWNTCTIPYAIDSTLNNTSRNDFLSAVQHWEQRSGLRFVNNPSAPSRIQVQEGAGCSSYLGQTGAVQPLVLNWRCGKGGAIHEIGHAVGLFHEQSRADRDQHVTIHWGRIQPATVYNFQTYGQQGQAGIDLGGYDLGSVMHYDSGAFRLPGYVCHGGNTSGCTITKRNGGFLYENQRSHLSSGDIAAVASLYPNCGGAPADDHGDTFDTATVVNGAMVVEGRLDPGDSDMFAVRGTAGQQLTVYTTGVIDTWGDLYRDGTLIGSDDDSGAAQNFAIAYNDSDQAHHIRVKGYDGNTQGAYTLRVESAAPPPPPPTNGGDDHGDTLQQATVITGDAYLSGNLTAGDNDYFRIQVAPGTRVTIGSDGVTDTVGDLIENGVQTATDDTTGEGVNFEMSFVASSADQVIRVRGWRAWTAGNYSLHVDTASTTTPPPPPPPPPVTDDHGDTEATATAVAMPGAGHLRFGASMGAGDTDVFRLNSGFGTLTVFSDGTTDVAASLYDANGVALDSDDDGAGGQQFLVSTSVPTPAPYYLFVRGGSLSASGYYTLDLTLE